jgi:CubicO group peptidase (beta-lactamase class C family)
MTDPVDSGRFADLLDTAFGSDAPAELGLTQAVVVIQHGTLVAERYGEPFHSELDALSETGPLVPGPDTTMISWSMAKSMLHAVIGQQVGRGAIDLDEPAPVPEWSSAGDPRGAITWRHLLTMSPALEWAEDYVDEGVSDVIQMLFGSGADDMAAYAADKPLVARPGHRYNYSSGTSNILARCLQRVLGLEGDADGMAAHLRSALFEPIGMTSAIPKFDPAGTFVASSYVYATARDFARFGLLYLRDGVWDGRRVLPEGWVDTAREPTETDPERRHSAHWWVQPDGLGTFACDGYEGQRIVLVPALDLVVVRLGKTPAPPDPPPGQPAPPHPVEKWIDQLVACFA